ncbi:PhzF family phenazine biosynthesis protein [Phenylobacterium sp.]|uniref:PhzF family phenazine biosynthesis protein n=1 Tax=Phenylobacterium sp. TaxID=1871053 RepID=UPI003D2CD223
MRQWTIDAFAAGPFLGNAACVLEPFDLWPPDAWMQSLAAENGAGATGYLLRTGAANRFGLRWFTPATEVPLCGHATLAAAHALRVEQGLDEPQFAFETASGDLIATAVGDDRYELSFPRPAARRIATPAGLADALGAKPAEVWAGPYLVARFDDAGTIARLDPRYDDLRRISERLGGQGNVGVVALATEGAPHDVVDRFFAPGYGLREDPATGSFHAILVPIFAERLPSRPIRFRQACPGRGADFEGRLEGERVVLRGRAVTVMESRLRTSAGAGSDEVLHLT